MTYRPPCGTIPQRALAWLESMVRIRPGYEPSTAEICDGISCDTDGFTAYMRPAREHGAVHTRKASPRVLRWRLGDGTPDPMLGRVVGREPGPNVIQTVVSSPLPPIPPADFRALEWDGHLLATGMEIRDGVAIFTPDMVQELKRRTDWWRAA